ncbi:MAG: glycoside hydrolase family 68 protein [Paracoccaceae bacterium]|uniref:glycoside hydrolase family 68 protein n=1 Tax=Hyphomonas sp. TaxID=87 RepID=UPI00326F8F9F
MTSVWTAEQVGTIDLNRVDRVPIITEAKRGGLQDGRVYWDMWPIQNQDGRIANCRGRELWMALTAPDRGDPSLRHFEAKIRLLERLDGSWHDLGDVLPNEPVPYEREWAGSAVKQDNRVSLYFTAAGTAERGGGYQQKLFEAHAILSDDGLPTDWADPAPSIAGHSPLYDAADVHEGEAGKIKAFRDPAFFRDPADGCEYLIFTASLADAQTDFNGAAGIARREENGWALLPPIIHADGVNNELERAHVVFHEGRYYAFWVTQSSTFAPGLRDAPNGLYGMVSDSITGEYSPLNGSGLVLANPQDEPLQAYSWFVSRELLVSSFIDFWGLSDVPAHHDPEDMDRKFGGVPAPLLQLKIDGDCCELVQMETA